jgi:hypothetical protein
MTEAKTRYVQARESLLTHITETLKHDERFVAAWLAGSFGRGEQKWSSVTPSMFRRGKVHHIGHDIIFPLSEFCLICLVNLTV